MQKGCANKTTKKRTIQQNFLLWRASFQSSLATLIVWSWMDNTRLKKSKNDWQSRKCWDLPAILQTGHSRKAPGRMVEPLPPAVIRDIRDLSSWQYDLRTRWSTLGEHRKLWKMSNLRGSFANYSSWYWTEKHSMASAGTEYSSLRQELLKDWSRF